MSRWQHLCLGVLQDEIDVIKGHFDGISACRSIHYRERMLRRRSKHTDFAASTGSLRTPASTPAAPGG
jgi:hypothetical protein